MLLYALLSVESSRPRLASAASPSVSAYSPEKIYRRVGVDHLKLLCFLLLVVLELIHVLLELLDLRLGHHLLLLRGLQGGLHLRNGALKLLNLRTDLKHGGRETL